MPTPTPRPRDARERRVRALLLPAIVVAALLLTGCSTGGGDNGPVIDAGGDAASLVVSAAYAPTGDAKRTASLRTALDRLRRATGSGWVGHQDDVTGYLGDLSGGRFFADGTGYAGSGAGSASDAVTALLDDYGPALFGVTSADLALGEASAPTITGSGTIRATQRVSGVPVVDSALTITVKDPDGDARVNEVRGRVYPGLDVSVTPTVTAEQAAASAAQLSGGRAGTPELVVLATDTGRLAWRTGVSGAAAGLGGSDVPTEGVYFLDAQTGELIDVRPATAELAAPRPRGPVIGRAVRAVGSYAAPGARTAAEKGTVQVSGNGPLGTPLSAVGLKVGKGVQLLDTTTSTWDPDTGDGGIYTFDAQGGDGRGKAYVQKKGTTISDPEALAAQSFSRDVFDYYYESYGRRSWDDGGSPLISTVHEGADDFCNAYFTESSDPPQMFYGNPCYLDGALQLPTFLDIDIAGHEITHGVTASTAALNYSGQSGALNEAFSDFFGNIIGNLVNGTDSSTLGETPCAGAPAATILCSAQDDGTFATRNLLTGDGFDDYLYTLDPGFRLSLLGDDQDHGGVHSNSAVWNNALWTIRSRLAQIDGQPGNTSGLARTFDAVVYATLTTQLGPTAGMVDAADAVEATAVQAGADPTVVRVIREVFQETSLCDGCTDPDDLEGDVVTATGAAQVSPAVHGDDVAWVDLSAGNAGIPQTSVGGAAPSNVSSSAALAVAFAGDALIAINSEGSIVRYADGAPATRLAKVGSLGTVAAGLAGSAEGAAWVDDRNITYVDAAGKVTKAALLDLGGSTIDSVGTGAGLVAYGTDDGKVVTWRPGGGFDQVGQLKGAVLATTAYDDTVFAVDTEGNGVVFDAGGDATAITDQAIPYGATMNGDYVVWTQAVDDLGGGVAETEGAKAYDTDLYLYSLTTDKVYALVAQRGQQAFPALDGDRLVWQDAVFGGDDILTTTVDDGL